MYRRFLLAVAFGASSIAFFFFILLNWLRYRTYLGDYIIFWQAGAGWRLYSDIHVLPFAYPPTSLFLLRPFGLLPFWWALAAWTMCGLAALSISTSRLVPARALCLGMLSASVLWLTLDGQISWFVVPLIIAGVVTRRPCLAGLCFAGAGVIKPQTVVAIPIALLASRNYRAFGWGALFTGMFVAASIFVWGTDLWIRWFHVLGNFQNLLAERELDRADSGIAGLALKLGLPSWLYLLGVPLGCMCVWRTYSQPAPLAERYAAVACASVLLSRYVLAYDLAALSIVSTAFLLDKNRSPMMWRASAMIVSEVLTAPGLVLMALCLAARRPATATADEPCGAKQS